MNQGFKNILLLLIILLWANTSISQENTLCRSVEECVQELHVQVGHFGASYSGLSKAQSDFISHVVKFGDSLVDRVVPLLEDPDEGVATMAAAILRDVEKIDEKYLPQIIGGLDRGIRWLPPALGRIGSSEAAEEAVKRFLVSRNAPHNQEAYAIRLFGMKAVPYMAKAVSCEYGCENNPQYLLAEVLADMDDETKARASKEFMKVVMDKNTLDEVSRGVLSMYWRIGSAGIGIEEELLQLKIDKPRLIERINYALVGIGSNHAGKIFKEALRAYADASLLDDIASRGLAAHDAGPEVVKVLRHPDLEIRLKAVEALGAIGYEESADELVPLLWDPVDVRVNYAAAVSLGKLEVKSDSAKLRQAANKHWYPPVRKAAKEAIDRLHNKTETSDKGTLEPIFLGYFGEVESCSEIALEFVAESSGSKLYKSESPEILKKLAFKTEVLGYTAADEAQQRAEAEAKGETAIITVTPDNMVEVRTPVEEVPDVALRVKGGWLVGSDRGEWGGDLVFITEKGETQKILSENIQDIYLLGDRYIAVTGLAHLVLNDGIVYEIFIDADDKWTAKPWRVLPGSPSRSGFVNTGELFIDTRGGGSLLLSKNGEFKMAECG